MKKKRNKRLSRIKYHVEHKSKLTLLLIVKILLVIGIAVIAFIFTFPHLQSAIGFFPAALLCFAAAIALYLFLMVNIVRLFKFE